MLLALQQLIPVYFTAEQVRRSEVWLKDITITKGELVEIVAPSGSGKTSLVHFLYGMRKDYRGNILYDKAPLSGMDHEQMAAHRKDKLSVVFQDMRLFNDQTVMQNIEIKRQLSPFYQPDVIGVMASRLGISAKLDALCGNCSYGEQQRVAIIRALMQPFDVLLLDEPFSHLDNNNSQKAMELIIEEAAHRQATIIFADLERTSFFPHHRLFHL